MPSQLVNNSAVYFVCARDFTYNGEDYKMCDTFDEEVGTGRIDMLVRTRRLFAVVDDSSDKPRHWHHHVWTKKQIKQKLKLNDETSSAYNKPAQNGIVFDSVETDKPELSDAEKMRRAAEERIATERVLAEENDENEEVDPEEQAEEEPQNVVGEGEEIEEDDRVITEDDLYDPADHTVPEVEEYLEGASEEERARVLAAEKNGKNRKGLTGE